MEVRMNAFRLLASAGALLLAACAPANQSGGETATGQVVRIAPGNEQAPAQLASSPRHGEWVTIANGESDSVRAWVVYPERRNDAPVVIVVHEIYGLTPWIRSVADQLAAEGFIAIAPDYLTGKGVPDTPDGPPREAAVSAVRSLSQSEVQQRTDAVARYGMALPSAARKYGIVGFCWGGSVSFNHAVHAPSLGAAVVYYGSSPATERLSAVRAPVLGLYGRDDARVNATIPAADSAMTAMGKTYVQEMYEGAGHGFLRQQDGRDGANLAAAQKAWPATIAWFRRHLG
jgi:carboxymethylenebutenolidase